MFNCDYMAKSVMSMFVTNEQKIDCGKSVGICTGAACPKYEEELACCGTCAKKETCSIVCKHVKAKKDPKYCKFPQTCPPLDNDECEYIPVKIKNVTGYSQTCCQFCAMKKDCDIICPIILSGIEGKDDKFYNDFVKIAKE